MMIPGKGAFLNFVCPKNHFLDTTFPCVFSFRKCGITFRLKRRHFEFGHRVDSQRKCSLLCYIKGAHDAKSCTRNVNKSF